MPPASRVIGPTISSSRSLDGETVKQLTAEDANDAAPAFSSDGSLIVFTRDKTYNWGGLASNWDEGGVLCVMNADGTGLRQITIDEINRDRPPFLSRRQDDPLLEG